MTHRLALLLVLLCTAPVHGAGFEPITRLRIDDTGAMAFDDVKIAIVHFSKAWRCSRQTRSMLHVERRVDKPDGWSLRGSLSLLDTDQALALTLAMRPVGDAAFSYAARFAKRLKEPNAQFGGGLLPWLGWRLEGQGDLRGTVGMP